MAGDSSASALTQAVCAALREVIGTYGIAVISAEHPGVIVGARRGSPLIIGIGEGENFLTSDANAIVAHTRQVVYLNDYDVATITADRFDVQNLGTETATVQISQLEFDSEDAERGDYEHFMLKEIYEQPGAVQECVARAGLIWRGRPPIRGIEHDGGGIAFDRAHCHCGDGTSWHAALVGEYLIEELAHLPVEVEFAHEFYNRNAPLQRDTVLLVISQSGRNGGHTGRVARSETARASGPGHLQRRGKHDRAGSGRRHLYARRGPEIGVASTKAFISMLTVLRCWRCIWAGCECCRCIAPLEILHGLEAIPQQIEGLLQQAKAIKKLSSKYAQAKDFFFLSRGYTYPIALEGALKLKEISYIHAEGYSAAEMKHGPIALIDPVTPTVFLVPKDSM